MLDFLKAQDTAPVAEATLDAAARELAAAQEKFEEVERRWLRVDSICRPAPGAPTPPNLSESEVEESFAIWPSLRKERHDAKVARDTAAAKVAALKTARKRALEAAWLDKLADSYEQVASVMAGELRTAAGAFLALRREAEQDGIRPDPDQPHCANVDALDDYVASMRRKIQNWRGDIKRLRAS